MDVVDLRADGESADKTDYATCQMCGNEKIRYVHIMKHPDLTSLTSSFMCAPPLEVHPIHSLYCARLHPICAARPVSADR